MQQPRVFLGSPMEQTLLNNSQLPKSPCLTGHPFPIVPPGLQMPPGTPRPPGLQVSHSTPGLQMPLVPLLPSGLQMLPNTPGSPGLQRHPGPLGPHVPTDLLRQQVPSDFPGLRILPGPCIPLRNSGFQVEPHLRGLGHPPFLPGPSGFPHLPVPPSFPRRQRKERTVYTKEQVCVLEEEFDRNQYPSYKELLALAEKLQLTDNQIRVWFKNHRAKISRLYFKDHLQRPPWMWARGAHDDLASYGAGAGPSCSADHKAPAAVDEVCLGPSGDVPQQSPSDVCHSLDQNGRSCTHEQSSLDEHMPGVVEDVPLPLSAIPATRAPPPAPEAAQHAAADLDACKAPAARAPIPAPEAPQRARAAPGTLEQGAAR